MLRKAARWEGPFYCGAAFLMSVFQYVINPLHVIAVICLSGTAIALGFSIGIQCERSRTHTGADEAKPDLRIVQNKESEL